MNTVIAMSRLMTVTIALYWSCFWTFYGRISESLALWMGVAWAEFFALFTKFLLETLSIHVDACEHTI